MTMVVLASTFKPVLSFASVPPPLAILSRPYSHTLLTRGGSSRTGAPSLPPTAAVRPTSRGGRTSSGPRLAAVASEEEIRSYAQDFLGYVNEAWTPFHAVIVTARRLREAGFEPLKEGEAWRGKLKPGGRYFFTRNLTTLIAFAVGKAFKPGQGGFTIVGAHTDSPCPKFDRDLSLAGRVLVKRGSKVVNELVKIERPILRIPTLAIHLTTDDERASFGPNLQNHFPPILATEIKARLIGDGEDAKSSSSSSPVGDHHHPLLLKLLAQELKASPGDIQDFELQVCDAQPGQLGGALGEFIFSGRLDNLCSSYQAMRALVDSTPTEASLADEKHIRLIALFDHEECGSGSAQGAASTLLPSTLRRITEALGAEYEDDILRTFHQSFIVSADMAHAVHPNYADRHDASLQPRMHGGLVIKQNANQRYATNAVSAFLFRELAKKAGVPVQEFAVKADSRCGSTIGPLVAGLTSIRVVDAGTPQLSMHSAREIMGTTDVMIGCRHFKAVFEYRAQVEAETSAGVEEGEHGLLDS